MIDLPLTDVKFNGMGVTSAEGQAEFVAAQQAGLGFADHKTHWLYHFIGQGEAVVINTKTGNRKEISLSSTADWTGDCMKYFGAV